MATAVFQSAIMRTAAIFSCFLAAAACGGDSGTELEGVYEITAWTAASPCDAPGTSVIDVRGPTTAFVKLQTFFGQEIFVFVQCASVAECAANAGEDDTLHLGNFTFDEGDDKDGWKGTGFVLGSLPPAACSGTVDSFVMTGSPGNSVTIRKDTVMVSDIPRDSDGACDDEAALAAAKAQACTGREVVEASFVQAI